MDDDQIRRTLGHQAIDVQGLRNTLETTVRGASRFLT